MSTATTAIRMNPFPGLRPFREDEEYLFFGRENEVDAMVDKLAATRFLAVVGASGSGKSSLVNCGLHSEKNILSEPAYPAREPRRIRIFKFNLGI